MANISLTQRAAKVLKIDTKKLESLPSSNFDDWLITDIWDSKRDPWLFFMHKTSFMCFVVNPNKYTIEKAIEGLLFVLRRYLNDNGLLHKFNAFEQSFKNINIYKHSDNKATANINARRAGIYYRPRESFNDNHLNYILNIDIHSSLFKNPSNKSEYSDMFEAFNNYLIQVPSFGLTSIKKPAYSIMTRFFDRDNMLSISGTKFLSDLKQYFSHVPDRLEINAFCGIAFGLIILSDGIETALAMVETLSQDFVSGSIFNIIPRVKELLTDLVCSYFHILETRSEDMYLIDYEVPAKIYEASGNGLYFFSLGVYYTIFLLFKSELRHRNHPIVMSRQASFQKIEDFISANSSNGNSIEYESYVEDLKFIINDLYRMHKEASTKPAETIH